MAPRARKLAVIAALVAITATAAGTALPFPNRDGEARRSASGPALRVTGSVVGLFPGVTKRLPVRIRNRRAFAVVVRSISVRVGAGRRGCPGRVVRVRPFRGRLVVAARKQRVVALPITMVRTAPQACRGARFALRFRAVARRR